jgi:hypothetical protein
MNRTLKEATVKRYYYENHHQLNSTFAVLQGMKLANEGFISSGRVCHLCCGSQGIENRFL